jgi:hypothetical protein
VCVSIEPPVRQRAYLSTLSGSIFLHSSPPPTSKVVRLNPYEYRC